MQEPRMPVRRSISLLVAVCLLAAGCGASPDFGDLAEAGRRTSEQGSARIAVTSVVDGGLGQPKQRTDATGLIQFEPGSTELEVRIGAPAFTEPGWPGDAVPMVVIGDGAATYVRSAAWPVEQPWTQLAADDAAAQGGLGSADLGSRLELLAGGVTALEEVGEEEVRGVPSVHYRVTVDLPRAAEAAPEDQRAILTDLAEQGGITELPFDLWVGEGLVRRMSYRLDLPRAAEGESATAGLAGGASIVTIVEYFDFGVPFQPRIPDDVVLATAETVTAAPTETP